MQCIGVQCSMFRTVCVIRHGCRWFQTETRCLQSALIPFVTTQSVAETAGLKPSARIKNDGTAKRNFGVSLFFLKNSARHIAWGA